MTDRDTAEHTVWPAHGHVWTFDDYCVMCTIEKSVWKQSGEKLCPTSK